MSFIFRGYLVRAYEESEVQRITFEERCGQDAKPSLSQASYRSANAGQNVVHELTMSASPGSFLDMKNLKSHLRPSESESAFYQDPQATPCALNVEKHCSTLLAPGGDLLSRRLNNLANVLQPRQPPSLR